MSIYINSAIPHAGELPSFTRFEPMKLYTEDDRYVFVNEYRYVIMPNGTEALMYSNTRNIMDRWFVGFGTSVFVNGYGVPQNILTDDNYGRYLGAVVSYVKAFPDERYTIHLCGGYTNRPDKTEAAAMLEWFDHFGCPKNASLHLIEVGDTARDNMIAFQKRVETSFGSSGVLFCEVSRRHTMGFFACLLLAHYELQAVKFDTASLSVKHKITQIIVKLPLEILAWHFTWFDQIRIRARARHIARARAENK